MDANESLLNLSVSQLRKAADLKESIDVLNSELLGLLGGEIPVPFSKGAEVGGGEAGNGRGGRRKMSAAGRARIGAAAKARWAKIRASKSGSSSPTAPVSKGKRTMSAAARKKIAAAQKARWAKVRAQKAQ